MVGAGLAGLSAAVWLARAGRSVTVYEAAGHAGGRCRSFFDEVLDRRIDNGNHLLLSGNEDTHAYLEVIGATERLIGPEHAEFPFLDLESGERWTVRPGSGRIPWWILSRARRIPGTRLSEYLRALRLAKVGDGVTVAQCLDDGGVLFRRFWEPLAVAALNTDVDDGAASLLWPVVRETFGRGEAACRPRIADPGLSECFVDPALQFLEAAGATVRFRNRLRSLVFEGDAIAELAFTGGETVKLGAGDMAILAVPPAGLATLLPSLETPRESRAIVNGHFLVDPNDEHPSFLGLIGGLCQWLFVRGDVASVTVSAADSLAEEDSDAIATRMWKEIARALGQEGKPLPAFRIVKEKRATFAQTPAEARRRPGCHTPWSKLFLAGDWTDTGLPATIEGSIRSGRTAANAVIASTTSS